MGTNLVNTNGCASCQVPRQPIVLTVPTISWSTPGVSCGNRRSRISCDNVPRWGCSCLRPPSCPMSRPPQRCTSIPTPCGMGGDAGPRGSLAGKMRRAADGRSDFPPLDHACVKAVACEAVDHADLPLSRLSTADSAAQAGRALGKPISPRTVWRIRAADAITPWQSTYWIFPCDPHCVEKAGRVLAL
jgi:hypothetical protein